MCHKTEEATTATLKVVLGWPQGQWHGAGETLRSKKSNMLVVWNFFGFKREGAQCCFMLSLFCCCRYLMGKHDQFISSLKKNKTRKHHRATCNSSGAKKKTHKEDTHRVCAELKIGLSHSLNWHGQVPEWSPIRVIRCILWIKKPTETRGWSISY